MEPCLCTPYRPPMGASGPAAASPASPARRPPSGRGGGEGGPSGEGPGTAAARLAGALLLEASEA